jgi:phosphoglycerate dehydrogenase-like enzyme
MARMRPILKVIRDPVSLLVHWSAEAESVLASFADWSTVDLGPELPPESRAAMVDAALHDADAVLLCGWDSVGIGYLSGERLASAPRLRFIGSTSHFRQAEFLDLAAAADQGIAICETAPLMAPWVAEYELALALATVRNLPQEHSFVERGGWLDWQEVQRASPDTLYGRRVGLASFGAIHRHLARLLEPFRVAWQAYDPYVQAKVMADAGGGRADDVAEMAAQSEVFFVATPPTPDTIGSISSRVINALPSGAVFILVGRMAVVDQPALLARLQRGDIRAGIDVYEPEPPALDSPFRTLPNVVHTPHRAGSTLAAHRRVFIGQCEEARRFFGDELLQLPLRGELTRLFTKRALDGR